MLKLSRRITIPCYDTDSLWRLKPTSFMNYCQEAANNHATILGFGYDDLIATRTAWVLSRFHIEFLKQPKWRQDVTFETWHKGLNRIFFVRDFMMKDENGEELVKATSSWLVLNLDTRRLVRNCALTDNGTECHDNAIEQPADKVVFPSDAEAEMVMEHKVGYSDVDMLGHTNNAMYMQWAMDAVGYDITSVRDVKSLTINFNHEVKAGETVRLYRAFVQKEEGLHVFVEVRCGEVSSFCVDILFQ